MNLPNKLTLSRIILIPFFIVFMIIPFSGGWAVAARCISAGLFFITAMTDFLDGHIARKYNLVTNFGKFLDPLADKMMVLGAMLGLTVLAGENGSPEGAVYMRLTAVAAFVILFRELAVTSLRLAASGSKGVVIAANMLGKIKTVTQIVFIMTALLEPVVFGKLLPLVWQGFQMVSDHFILSYATMAVSTLMTVISGLSYFKAYFPIINTNK